MTYDEQLQYYADLLIIQYRNQPRAQATIQALARQALCDNIAIKIRDAFNLDDAIGVQLDIVGKYANVSRDVLTFSGGTSLDDNDFRTLIRLALVVHNCSGSLKDIDDILSTYFGNSVTLFDNTNMTLGYFFNANIGSLPLIEAFVKLDLLPRPMGVRLSSLIYAVGLDNVFGMGSYDAPPFAVSGLTSYYGDTIATTGDVTSGSKIVINIPDTSILTAGDAIGGGGIDWNQDGPPPAAGAGTFIDTIDSPTQITLTKNAIATVTTANLYTQVKSPWLNYENVVSF